MSTTEMKGEVVANISREEHFEFRSISFVFCGSFSNKSCKIPLVDFAMSFYLVILYVSVGTIIIVPDYNKRNAERNFVKFHI